MRRRLESSLSFLSRPRLKKKKKKAWGCAQQLNASLACMGPGFDPKHHNREGNKTTAQLRKCFFFKSRLEIIQSLSFFHFHKLKFKVTYG